MGAIPGAKDQWYVVHVLSGQEQKVVDNINRRIKSEEMGDLVFEVLLPQERISEVNKKGKKTETKRKFFPGYLMINIDLLQPDGKLVEKSWYFVRETPGIINFAGTRDKPTPMKEKEVESMLLQIRERAESVKPKIQFEINDSVKIIDGSFDGQFGFVTEINHDEGKLRVSVSIFGRETPVDVHFWQVEKERPE